MWIVLLYNSEGLLMDARIVCANEEQEAEWKFHQEEPTARRVVDADGWIDVVAAGEVIR